MTGQTCSIQTLDRLTVNQVKLPIPSPNLQQVVLQDVPDDAELVKVAAAALSAEGLLEGDNDGGDVVAVPRGAEDGVGESHGDQVLHHLLAEIVVDAVELRGDSIENI